MRRQDGSTIEAGARAAEFAAAHPMALPGIQEEQAWLGSLVQQALGLMQAERDGRGQVDGSVSVKAALRARLWDELVTLRTIAETAAARARTVEPLLRLPGRRSGVRVFVTGARLALSRARGREAVLQKYGLEAGRLDEIAALITQFEATIADKRSGNAAHVLANASLADLAEEIRESLRHLDALYRRPFRDKPDLKEAWGRARAVTRRRRKEAPPEEGQGTGTGAA